MTVAEATHYLSDAEDAFERYESDVMENPGNKMPVSHEIAIMLLLSLAHSAVLIAKAQKAQVGE